MGRIVIVLFALSYMIIYGKYGHEYPNQNLVNSIMGLYVVYAVAMNLIIRLNPTPVVWRIYFAIIIDLCSLSLGFYLAGPYSGIFYPFILWAVVGNGLRFGERYLLVATAIAETAMIIAMSNSDYWQHQFSFAFALLVGVIILPLFYVVILRELESANKELKKQIDVTAYAATHDSLTRLYNRFIIMDRLSHAIKRSERNKNRIAVLIINIDKFKYINDTYGYNAGNCILKNVASRLQGVLRGIDSAGRLGADEFVILLSDLSSRYDARDGADRVMEIFNTPYNIEDSTLDVTASMGLSIFPDDADDADTLMQCADTAMQKARKRGGNKIQSFSYIKYRLKPPVF